MMLLEVRFFPIYKAADLGCLPCSIQIKVRLINQTAEVFISFGCLVYVVSYRLECCLKKIISVPQPISFRLMFYILNIFSYVFMLEQQRKEYCNNQGIDSKCEPDIMPVFHPIPGKIVVNHPAADQAAHNSSETVCHHHKQPLRTGADGRVGSCFHK